jgi:hypothetical protein
MSQSFLHSLLSYYTYSKEETDCHARRGRGWWRGFWPHRWFVQEISTNCPEVDWRTSRPKTVLLYATKQSQRRG